MQPELCFSTDSPSFQPRLKTQRISYMLANRTGHSSTGHSGTGTFTLLGTRDRKQGPWGRNNFHKELREHKALHSLTG